ERPEGAQEAAPAARQSERLLPAPRSAGPVGGGDGPAQELAADAVAGMDGRDPVLLYQEVRATGADVGTQGGVVCRRTRESLPFHRRRDTVRPGQEVPVGVVDAGSPALGGGRAVLEEEQLAASVRLLVEAGDAVAPHLRA